MTRPLRLEYPGALYHVTSRGDRRKMIFLDNTDREYWLDVVARVCNRVNFAVYAYCQMGNHFHLMLETIEGNLSQGMRQLNSLYSQEFNRRHRFVGHVLQGRYKAILVQKEAYLLELSRYVVLNPVRAGVVARPEDWAWSSYRAATGACSAPAWLHVDGVLSQFGAVPAVAAESYRRFVEAGIGKGNPLADTKHQMLLGDQAFVEEHHQRLSTKDFGGVIKEQRRLASMTLQQYQAEYPDRNEAMSRAYQSTAFTMVQIASHFGVSDKTVARAVKHHAH